MNLEQELSKKTKQLAENKKLMATLEKSTRISRGLLYDTITVKLRYEEIIKKIVENEKKGIKVPVEVVISETKAPD